MLGREQGWAFYDKRPDLWEMIDTDQGRTFVLPLGYLYPMQLTQIAAFSTGFPTRINLKNPLSVMEASSQTPWDLERL